MRDYTVLDVLGTYMENTMQTNEARKASYEDCFEAGRDRPDADIVYWSFEDWWERHRPRFHLDLGYLGYIEGCFKLGIPPHAYEDWLGATQSVPDIYTKLDEETRAYKDKSKVH